MEIEEQLKQYQKEINTLLEKSVEEGGYDARLKKAASYMLLAGGKRLRPILMLTTYEMFAHKKEEIIPYMVAIEMIHNFSLIHDDLPAIDNDDRRHGKKTCHKQFEESTAILAGDKLLNDAYFKIASAMLEQPTVPKKHLQAFSLLAEATSQMISGEFVDIAWEQKNISEQQLAFLQRYKTGALLQNAIRIGAVMGECPKQHLDALQQYGSHLGKIYQMQDDILNVEGDITILGKPIGTDAKMGKVTYVTKYGMEKAKETLQQEVQQAIAALDVLGDKAFFFKELTYYFVKRKK